MPNQNEWDEHWLRVADDFARLSKDPNTKVGAVLVTPDNRQSAGGYNGFARGVKEDEVKWARPTKYEYVIHAEMNALINCPFDTYGCTCYTPISPCHRCIIHLWNAGITRLVFREMYDRMCHIEIWREHAALFDEVIVGGKPYGIHGTTGEQGSSA